MNAQTFPKLSICIATMNRGDVIADTLESIVSQAGDCVEIIVIDGASTDNTPAIVDIFRHRFPALRYIREPINGGVDRDYDRAVQAATGEYCWLMSDDDLLAQESISAVLSAIDRGFSLIVVNAEVRTRDMAKIIESRRLLFDRDREYEQRDFDAFFKDAAMYMSFIGCVVIRRSIWMERERERYFGSLFIHMGVIFQAPLPGKVLIIAQPYISIRYANAMWKPREFEIWMFKWPTLLWSFESLSAAAREAVSKKEPWRKSKTLFFYRAKGTYSTAEYRKLIEPRLTSNEGRIGIRSVALIPGVIANLLALLYCLKPTRSSKMMRIDLQKSRYFFGNWFNAKRNS